MKRLLRVFIWIACVALILVWAEAIAEESPTDARIPVRQGELYGYIDGTGRFAIMPVFERARLFDGDRALVEKDGMWLIIDRSGATQVQLPAEIAYCYESFNGLTAYQQDKTDLIGFINMNGIQVVEPKWTFSYTYRFQDGVAVVNSGGNQFLIDTSGKVLTNRPYDSISGISEGTAMVTFKRQGEPFVTYIDMTGAEFFESQWNDGKPFSEGLAAVQDKVSGLYGFIDKRGQQVIPPKFQYISSGFSDGLASVKLPDDDKLVFIDKTGSAVFSLEGFHAEPFSEGLSMLCVEGTYGLFYLVNYYGYIDRYGDYVIQPQWVSADSFQDGVAIVSNYIDYPISEDTLVGAINTMGIYVIPPEWHNVIRVGKYLECIKDGKSTYFDLEGRIIYKEP